MAHPKNPASSSFALISLATILIATTSLANSQAPTDQASSPLTVFGTITCGLPADPPRPLARPVNVTLSCDGGRTALVPPVLVSDIGTFAINVSGDAVKVIDPNRCAAFVTAPVAGCPVPNPGEVLRAPIFPVLTPRLSIVIICYIRIYITFGFRIFRIA